MIPKWALKKARPLCQDRYAHYNFYADEYCRVCKDIAEALAQARNEGALTMQDAAAEVARAIGRDPNRSLEDRAGASIVAKGIQNLTIPDRAETTNEE